MSDKLSTEDIKNVTALLSKTKQECEICGYPKSAASLKYVKQVDKPDSKNECRDCIKYRNMFGKDPSNRNG